MAPRSRRVADLAGKGKLPISIERVARLEESAQLIDGLEAALRVKGKAAIVAPQA